MKRILFVDDEPNVLEALERMLFSMRREWRIAFADGGQKALDLMEREPFDILVTDLRMPGVDGAELLTKTRERYPDTIRFVLSGQSDQETIFRSVGPAHQFMSKPCNPKVLKANVDRAFALRDILSNKELKRIVSQAGTLPALPKTYRRLMTELESKAASVGTVGAIIESDIGMTAKILQMANSAFFGLSQQVTGATQAVSLLGLDAVKAMILVEGVLSQASGKPLPKEFSLDTLFKHSMVVGAYSKAIATEEKLEKGLVGDAFTAGLLHDSGMLLLIVNFLEDYKHVLDYAFINEIPLVEAEREHLGSTHAEVGAYLLGIWGLSDPIVEAVAFHHSPQQSPGNSFSPLTAVHVANVLEREMHGTEGGWGLPRMDAVYLERLCLNGRVDDWRDLCHSVDQKRG